MVHHAVLAAGADVRLVPKTYKNKNGGCRQVYTRDRYILIGDTAYLPDPEQVPAIDKKDYQGEIALIEKNLKKQGVRTITVKGAWFEGGNVIRHFRTRTLFIGIEDSRPDDAEKLIKAVNASQKQSWKIVNVPLTNYDQMYHMDTGMSEELPNGEILISRRLTDRKTFALILNSVGQQNLIELSREEADNLATNLLAVGRNIVLTSALPNLKAKLEARGYRVITPGDYSEKSFEFGGGGVHCMTNDLPASSVHSSQNPSP